MADLGRHAGRHGDLRWLRTTPQHRRTDLHRCIEPVPVVGPQTDERDVLGEPLPHRTDVGRRQHRTGLQEHGDTVVGEQLCGQEQEQRRGVDGPPDDAEPLPERLAQHLRPSDVGGERRQERRVADDQVSAPWQQFRPPGTGPHERVAHQHRQLHRPLRDAVVLRPADQRVARHPRTMRVQLGTD